MRKLIPLSSNFEEFQKTVYYVSDLPIDIINLPTRAKKPLISSNYSHIRSRYTEYETNKLKLEEIIDSIFTKESDIDLYNELFNLYDSKEELKVSIRSISNIQCPYCGINESPFHVDHILPRSKYPEFSIYSQNLVGACASCNSRYKGDDFIKDGERQFFNPYFDTFINDKELLKCTLSVLGIYLSVEFSINEELIGEYEYKIIKNHFDNLKLNKRYKSLVINSILKNFRDENINPMTREYEEITLVELKRDIVKKLRGFQDYNINHWEKVFWIELKECDEYLNLIVEKRLPIE